MNTQKKGTIIQKESDVKIHNDGTKEFTLPSGKVAKIMPFKFKHIQEAQKIAGDDTSNMMAALIAITTTIDEKKLVMEDVIEIEGWDGLALMGKFSGGFGK